MNKHDRHRYLASREWAFLKKAVRRRSGGKCERCGVGSHDATHHLTYERLGNELPDDLQAVCETCHQFLSGRSDVDPCDFSWYPRIRLGALISGIQLLKFLVETIEEFRKRGWPPGRLNALGDEIWSMMETIYISEEIINIQKLFEYSCSARWTRSKHL